MKQDFKTVRARYEKPALKEFRINLEGGICSLSGEEGLSGSSSESTGWDA